MKLFGDGNRERKMVKKERKMEKRNAENTIIVIPLRCISIFPVTTLNIANINKNMPITFKKLRDKFKNTKERNVLNKSIEENAIWAVLFVRFFIAEK